LVIDDDPVQLMIIGRMLSSQYDVKVAKSGEPGLKLAAEYHIDLILLDLVMQDMSGFEVLSRLKQSDKTKDIPVIIITGCVSKEDEIRGLSLGAADYIRKPYTNIIVSLRVKKHLQHIRQMEAVKSLCLTDGLTGISNRRGFDQVIKSTWNFARRSNECFSVLLLDIDRFKQFNDKYGHSNGDRCLRAIACVIQESIERGTDSVCRWGGEEFAVLLPSTHLDGAMFIAERIRNNIANTPIALGSTSVFVTASIGVGSIEPGDMEFDEAFLGMCMELVDKALYRAKENGRNRIEKAIIGRKRAQAQINPRTVTCTS